MNASAFADGGLISTNTFWEVSIPLVVGSIIVPIAFSGLLIRKSMQFAFYITRPFTVFLDNALAIFTLLRVSWTVWVVKIALKPLLKTEGDGPRRRQSLSENNEEVSDQALEMA